MGLLLEVDDAIRLLFLLVFELHLDLRKILIAESQLFILFLQLIDLTHGILMRMQMHLRFFHTFSQVLQLGLIPLNKRILVHKVGLHLVKLLGVCVDELLYHRLLLHYLSSGGAYLVDGLQDLL